MHNDSSIKYKMGLAYLILIVTTVFSGWYIYQQIENISIPKKNVATETNRIFILSDILTNVFASESSARIAMMSTKAADIKKYEQKMDSIQHQLMEFKLEVENENIVQKLDTIELLLQQKNKSFNEIIDFRKKYLNSQNFNVAFDEIRKTKKVIDQKNTTVPDSLSTKQSWLSRMITSNKTRERKEKAKEDLLKQSHEAKRDSFARAAETIFTKAIRTEGKLAQQYLKKEEQLINENKNITHKIRSLFNEVEQNILIKSNESIDESKAIINQTANNLIWSGSISFLLVFILGIIVIKDLNRNFEYKKRLEKLNAEMQEMIKQKTYFFASITHDIVAPLNTIVGFSNLLEKTLQKEKQKEYLQNIAFSTQYIHNLVTDLVDFSKLEHNQLHLKKESFQFGELVQSIILPLENEAKKKNISLTAIVDEEVNSYLFSDPYRIRQICINLLTNAIKFTHEGGVSFQATREKDHLLLTISDTGIGIEHQFHELIFNEFQQAHGGIEKVYGGTGLGLNITKRLVEMLEGTIRFESEIDKGTTFFISLPFVLGENKDKEAITVLFDNHKKLINKSILVIDDDKLQLKLMREILADKVKMIDTIDNGKVLHNFLEKNEYDLIITDIQMPNYSGYSIIRDIKKHTKYKSTPVIAFTGKTDLDEAEYFKLGFEAVLKKPIQIHKLLETIHLVLQINIDSSLLSIPALQSSVVPKDKLFDLTELLIFMQNDHEATKEIIHVFIETTLLSLEEMQEAFLEKNKEKISTIAHRMLPMFRQLKMTNEIDLLLHLERETASHTFEQLGQWIEALRVSSHMVMEKLKKIELY